MKRGYWLTLVSTALLAVFSTAASARIWVTSGNGDTNLYEIDGTGAIISTIGDTGQMFTGLAYYPPSGLLYGTTSPASATPNSVFTIDPNTGVATLVGAHGVDQAIVDLALASDGTLYGWLEPSNDDLVTINLATGAATVVGPSPGSAGRGIEFTPSGEIALFDATNAEILNPVTGLATGVNIPLTGSGDVNASFRVTSGLVYAINADGSGGTRALISVDFTTGNVTVLGPISVTNASGLASDGLILGPTTPTGPTSIPTLGGLGLPLLVLLAAALGVYTLRRRAA